MILIVTMIDDDEFTNEQKANFLDNLVVEHERLIKSCMKNNEVLKAHKNKIDMLDIEKTNLLEKVRFFFTLSIILSLRRTMLSLKRSRIISLFHQ